MKNKIIMLALITVCATIFMCGCDGSGNTQSATEALTQTSTQSSTKQMATATPSSATEVPTEAPTMAYVSDEPGTFAANSIYVDDVSSKLVDENVPQDETGIPDTNPTVPSNSSSPSSTTDITAENYFAGVWSPVAAYSISSGNEVAFTDAFGESYNRYGGAFTVYEGNYFEVGMGAYNEEHSHQGVFTVAGTSLNATYDDGFKDTFEYIANFEGKETVKVKIGDYNIYFSK